MMEVKVENCLTRGDSSDLVSVLRHEGLSSVTLTRLDRLVTKELCGCDGVSRVLVVLKCLEVLSENRDDLQTLVRLGLTSKLLLWFEALHDLLISDLQKSSAPLSNLTETFYDYFLLLSQASLPVSQLSVVLSHLVQFALEPEIFFPLRLEAIRTFNSILESLSREQRRLIQNDQNQIQILSQVAAALLTAGDYELQVSLSEALCRLTLRRDRQQRANQWFSRRDISTAFCDIRDRDFEADCRHFLNFVNRSHGDRRRVYTLPCLRAFLDSTELFPPKDDKLKKFWIDFNLSSGCVSFFTDDPQCFFWGSVHLQKQEVDQYQVQVNPDETVLSVRLINPIMHQGSRGRTVELRFDREHHQEVEEAAGRVFMVPASSSPWGQHTVLPLSSPSSDEDSSVMKERQSDSAEILFDRVRTSTPTFVSGVPVGAEPILKQEQTEEFGGSSACLKEVVAPDRKRAFSDSGYLSDRTEGQCAHKRRAWSKPEGEEPNTPLTESTPEGAEPAEEEQSASPEGAEPAEEEQSASPEGVCPPEEEAASPEGAEPAEEEVAPPEGAEPAEEEVAPPEGAEPAEEEPAPPEGAEPAEEEPAPPEGAEPAEEEPAPREGAEPAEDEALSPEGAEPAEEEVGGAESGVDWTVLTSGVTAALSAFRTHLEQQLTGCWRNLEAEVLLSFKETQQHVSSLLTAVHQHRVTLLQRFESSVSDQLTRLQENSTSLNSINTQMVRFFQLETQRLNSFCSETLQRLNSLDRDESGGENPSSQ